MDSTPVTVHVAFESRLYLTDIMVEQSFPLPNNNVSAVAPSLTGVRHRPSSWHLAFYLGLDENAVSGMCSRPTPLGGLRIRAAGSAAPFPRLGPWDAWKVLM
jgi:hypothetical protein